MAILSYSNTFFNFVIFHLLVLMPVSSPKLEFHEGVHAASFAHYCASSIYLTTHSCSANKQEMSQILLVKSFRLYFIIFNMDLFMREL